MKNFPRRVIWPAGVKERPKTLYLLEGFRRLGVPVEKSDAWVKKLKPPRNPLGPYLYPVQLDFGEKRPLVLYDIGTIPKINYLRYLRRGRVYFKIHVPKNADPRMVVAPNSPSRMEYLELLNEMREFRTKTDYRWDFAFLGWHDDRGLRIRTIRAAKAMDINTLAGLQRFKKGPPVPEKLKAPKLPYRDHLKAQCRTKLNLALAGGRALPWCSFRHVELWGMGCCVLTVPPDCRLVDKPSDCWVEYKRDLSDFEEIVSHYLYHSEERERIARQGREYFENHLTPEANARYIIEKTLQRTED